MRGQAGQEKKTGQQITNLLGRRSSYAEVCWSVKCGGHHRSTICPMLENCITNSIINKLGNTGNRLILVLFINYWRCWVWTEYYWFHFPKNMSNKMTKCLQSQTILSLGNSRASELCTRLWTEGSVWYVVFHSVSREDRKNYRLTIIR